MSGVALYARICSLMKMKRLTHRHTVQYTTKYYKTTTISTTIRAEFKIHKQNRREYKFQKERERERKSSKTVNS